MQMGNKEGVDERFAHYIEKTFMKTASLIAYTCNAVTYLAGADEKLQQAAFMFGRNLGIAFQLVDDLLDFVSNQTELGKPAAADLKLGLATAPVLFACQKFPELNELIIRRFSQPGDAEKAYDAVMKVSARHIFSFIVRLPVISLCRPFVPTARATASTKPECWRKSTPTRRPATLRS